MSIPDQPAAPREITYARVATIALPVVLSNAMAPLQGAIDTAIIGNLGEARYLAAVALGPPSSPCCSWSSTSCRWGSRA